MTVFAIGMHRIYTTPSCATDLEQHKVSRDKGEQRCWDAAVQRRLAMDSAEAVRQFPYIGRLHDAHVCTIPRPRSRRTSSEVIEDNSSMQLVPTSRCCPSYKEASREKPTLPRALQ